MSYSILHLSVRRSQGGAAVAAYSLHSALKKRRVRSLFWFVLGDEACRGRHGWLRVEAIRIYFLQNARRLFCKFFFKSSGLISFNLVPSLLTKVVEIDKYDIVHLHWVSGEFLSIYDINKIQQPIVWTLHDFWPIQGVCHAPLGLLGQPEKLGFVERLIESLLSRYKYDSWLKARITFVAPSSRVAAYCKQRFGDKFGEIRIVPHAVPPEIHYNRKSDARHKLLQEKYSGWGVITVGATGGVANKQKGLIEILEAIERLSARCIEQKILVLLFGGIGDRLQVGTKSDSNLVFRDFGVVEDRSKLSLIYSASDTFLVGSKFESFSLTALEAQACGCPIVIFNNLGATDILKVSGFGREIPPGDYDQLVCASLDFINVPDDRRRSCARAIARNFSETKVANTYLEIYAGLMKQASRL